jgi:hypothetical protein
MTKTQRTRKQSKAQQKTPRRPKAPTAKFWAERAARIAASRAHNEKTGMTERERRAQRKAERAKLAAKGAKPTKQPATKTPPTKTAPTPSVGRIISDKSSGAYLARVLKTINRNAKAKYPTALDYVGADAGAGWVILGTDGHRALLQVGTASTTAKKIGKPFVTATGPAYGFDLTPDVERALRALDADTLTLRIDAKRKRLSVTGRTSTPTVDGPIAGTLASASVMVDRRYLLDGLGRGGRLRYDAKPDRVLIETPDALRYLLMAKQPTAPPKWKPTTTKPTTKPDKLKTTKTTTRPATRAKVATPSQPPPVENRPAVSPDAPATSPATTTDPIGVAQ